MRAHFRILNDCSEFFFESKKSIADLQQPFEVAGVFNTPRLCNFLVLDLKSAVNKNNWILLDYFFALTFLKVWKFNTEFWKNVYAVICMLNLIFSFSIRAAW